MPTTINVYPALNQIASIPIEGGAVSVLPQPTNVQIYNPAGPQGPKGDPGAGLLIKGSVATSANLPATGNVYGDLWIARDTGHGWLWESPGIWSDIGQIQGAMGPVGPQGLTGSQGPAGNAGTPGIIGPPGPSGATGAPGAQGPIGNSGSIGPSGPQGAQGPQGSIGNQGPQGLKGDPGATGPAGATGSQGIAGPQGSKGDPGTVGAAGATGPQGATGSQGPKGDPGPSGPAGSPGATGAIGAQGPTGPQGLTGATGVQGPQGLTGATGAPGAAGAIGATGPAGPTGLTGATGPQGSAGASITGPAGPPGNQGPAGPAGATGAQGTQGPTGSQGQGYRWRGDWQVVIAYVPYDTVSHNGGSYVAVAPNTGVDPATDNGASWQIVATPGGTGAPGPAGSPGPTGPTGPQGIAGAQGAAGAQGPTGPQGPPGPPGSVHHVRVRAANNALNVAVPNGGALQFDTVDYDADGFAPTTTPFNRITVPAGFDGVYLIVCDSSTTGNQGSTIGMGIGINGIGVLSPTNEYVTGPASVTYAFTAAPSQIAHLKGGDYVQLINNSTSGANDPFTSVFLAMARLDVGGPIGPQGPQGLPGAIGPAGITGPKGDIGSQGPTGGTGPQGPPGSAGPQGIQGSQGPIGDTGPAGATGPQGSTGPQGIAGPTGPAGSQGPAGATGVQGPQGPQGNPGPTGPTGPQGPGFNWRGVWSASTAYAVNDTVQRTNSSYVCIQANTGQDPAIATTYWQLVAAQGATGATGATGPQGPTAISANANNKTTLGSDSLILVQGTAPGVAAITHAQTVSGDDPQLTNARTPTAHHTTHEHGGSDPISITYSDLLSIPTTFAPTAHQASHITGTDQLPLASSSTKGLLNQTSGNTTDFIDGTNNSQALQPVIWNVRLRSFNAIGNPTFEVDQRNVGTALTNPANGTFIQDRWSILKSAGLIGTVNFALQSVPTAPIVIPGTNFGITQNYQRYTVGTAQASLAAGDFYGFTQYVEGPCWRELALDVHSTEILVRSSVAGTFALRLRDPTTTHSLVKLCTISAANTWTLIQLPNLPVWVGTYSTLPGGVGYNLDIFLACGSTYLAAASSAWQNGDIRGVSGMSNFLATTGATFDIAFIQHEPGALCTTPIDCPFTQNFDECARYFTKSYAYSTASGTPNAGGAINSISFPNADITGYFPFKKRMARAPTVTAYSSATGAANNVRDSYVGTDRAILGISTSDDSCTYLQLSTHNAANTLYAFHYAADTGW